MMNKKERLNFCEAFAEKVSNIQGVENKARYLLEDFFFNEGWASKDNPKVMKKGYHQMFKYSKQSISHFIEDFVRLFNREFELEWKKVLGKLNPSKPPVRVYCCNCGDLFVDRNSLVKHISNKKKGKYRDKHFGGDFVTGNKTGLVKVVRKIK